MNSFRNIGYYIDSLLNNDPSKADEYCSELGFSNCDLNRLCEGRLGLTPSQLKKTASFFDKSISDIMNYTNSDFYAKRIHCRGDFSKQANCEKILDIIDSYIDVREGI